MYKERRRENQRISWERTREELWGEGGWGQWVKNWEGWQGGKEEGWREEEKRGKRDVE